MVVLPDPVDMNQIGRAYCARRSARDDDDQVATLEAAHLQEGVIDLADLAQAKGLKFATLDGAISHAPVERLLP